MTEEVRRQHLWRPVAEIEVNNVCGGGGNDALHRVTCLMQWLCRVNFFTACSLFDKDVHLQRRIQRRFLHTHDGTLTEEGLFVP